MELILVRHAETAHNRDGLVQGRADHELSDRGRAQAAALARALRDRPVQAVYSSPLRRALATAEAVAAAHGLPVRVEPDLTELDVGEMEGLSLPEMRERYADFLQRWLSPEAPGLPLPGGESLEACQARVWGVIQRIREAHPEGTVVVVSHNFALMTVLCRLLGLPLAGFRRLRQSVAGYSVAEVREGRTLLRRLNETCHLEEAGLGAPEWRREAAR